MIGINLNLLAPSAHATKFWVQNFKETSSNSRRSKCKNRSNSSKYQMNGISNWKSYQPVAITLLLDCSKEPFNKFYIKIFTIFPINFKSYNLRLEGCTKKNQGQSKISNRQFKERWHKSLSKCCEMFCSVFSNALMNTWLETDIIFRMLFYNIVCYFSLMLFMYFKMILKNWRKKNLLLFESNF